jgi:hypothetical protein
MPGARARTSANSTMAASIGWTYLAPFGWRNDLPVRWPKHLPVRGPYLAPFGWRNDLTIRWPKHPPVRWPIHLSVRLSVKLPMTLPIPHPPAFAARFIVRRVGRLVNWHYVKIGFVMYREIGSDHSMVSGARRSGECQPSWEGGPFDADDSVMCGPLRKVWTIWRVNYCGRWLH